MIKFIVKKFFSKFAIVLLKKEFTSSRIFLSFFGNSLSSTSFIFWPRFSLFEKKVSLSSEKA